LALLHLHRRPAEGDHAIISDQVDDL
jgi:hypothetical protein